MKKTTKKKEESFSVTPVQTTVKVCSVSKLEVDFGREDLNAMRDKLNEVICKLNG